MRRALAVVALLALPLFPEEARADRVGDLLAEGNRHYEQGDYAAAGSAYQRIIDYGVRNKIVYYNLGNARFKQGQLGEAILAYERGLNLDPGDREARENLAYAASLTVDRAEDPEPSFPRRAVRWLVSRTTAPEDAWLLLLAVYLLGAASAAAILVRSRFARRALAYVGTVVLIMALLSGTALAIKEARSAARRGVILAQKVDALSGPSEDNTSLFTVHEGLRVEVRNQREGWVQILLSNGLNGWVPASALGIV